MTTSDSQPGSQDPGTRQETVIDIKSRDAAGNITEHIRIHPGGREEKII
jgi:hypothetical protein